MGYISNIRQQLNLSQYGLAMLLLIPRSQIAMAEAGLRDLPMAAWIKLNTILDNHIAAKNMKGSASEDLATAAMDLQRTATIKALRIFAKKCDDELFLAKRRLLVFQKRYDAAITQLQMVSGQLMAAAAKHPSYIYPSQLNGKAAEASLKLDNTPMHSIELLKIKIASLEAALQATYKRLEEI